MSALLTLLLLLTGSLAGPTILAPNAEVKPGAPIAVTGSENGVVGLSGPAQEGRSGLKVTSRPPTDIVRPTCMYRPTLIGQTRVSTRSWSPEARFGASYFFSCPGTDGVVWLDAPPGPFGSYRCCEPPAARSADGTSADSRSHLPGTAGQPPTTHASAARPDVSRSGAAAARPRRDALALSPGEC